MIGNTNMFVHFLEVTGVDAVKKQLVYKQTDGTCLSVKKIDYDVLISSAPIEQLVRFTRLCPEPKLLRNKVIFVAYSILSTEKLFPLYFADLSRQ